MPEITLDALSVPLDGYTMRLRPSELEAVASCFAGELPPGEAEVRLAAALHGLPSRDRASTWELAVRHFGRRTPLGQAAAEIGMDVLHARHLLDRFREQLAVLPPA
jgi:hypothetical protein